MGGVSSSSGRALALTVLVALAPLAPAHESDGRSARPAEARRGSRAAPAPSVVRARRRAEDGAIDRVLASTPLVRAAGGGRRDLALTFDDGPDAQTAAILTTLERHGAPATFFVIGRQASARPELVRRELRDGFAVEDHTHDHARLAGLGEAAQRAQIARGAAAITATGAPVPRLLRPPYGAYDAATLRILRSEQRLAVLWSVDTRDYTRPGSDQIVAAALEGARPGAIVLLHDGGGDRRQTAAALARIVHRLRQRHYHLVTVPELLRLDPPAAAGGQDLREQPDKLG
jgi:peptidoglycan/xylan/chitin deacetylase (PgdA/CDA1 family)